MGGKREGAKKRVVFYMDRVDWARLIQVIACQHFKEGAPKSQTDYLEQMVVLPHIDGIERKNPELTRKVKPAKAKAV